MTDNPKPCPACKSELRVFESRLACDSCQGAMVPIEDLRLAIQQLTSIAPALELVDEEPGSRACPWCTQAMTRLKIRVVLEDEVAKPRPELDRCAEHGIWFDGEELAKVFEKSLAKIHRGRGLPLGWTGNASGFSWWKSGNMR